MFSWCFYSSVMSKRQSNAYTAEILNIHWFLFQWRHWHTMATKCGRWPVQRTSAKYVAKGKNNTSSCVNIFQIELPRDWLPTTGTYRPLEISRFVKYFCVRIVSNKYVCAIVTVVVAGSQPKALLNAIRQRKNK